MREFEVSTLLTSEIVRVRNVHCHGTCSHRSAEECTTATHLVFPYRGLYVRHVGSDEAVADANHILFFNAHEGYQVSHPLSGPDSTLDVVVEENTLRELVPAHLTHHGAGFTFRRHHLRIDPRAQALVALLRHVLQSGTVEPLEAEGLTLTLVCRSLGPRSSHQSRSTRTKHRLVDRVKVLLASDLKRRWSLAEIGAEIGGSPVYLTQVFQEVEGVPLYRYQLRLRLARALDLITQNRDISSLAHDLGFSSHSHFAAAFRQLYARSPSEFRRQIGS